MFAEGFTSQNEAFDRNAILTEKHGKIPSYALWRDIDIENESINTRYNWWKNEDCDSEIVISWKYHLCSLLGIDKDNNTEKEGNNKKNNLKLEDKEKPRSKKNNSNYEYCSKRAGDELYCDI